MFWESECDLWISERSLDGRRAIVQLRLVVPELLLSNQAVTLARGGLATAEDKAWNRDIAKLQWKL